MIIKKFDKQQYELLKQWWNKHQHPVVPLEMLSTFGLIASNGIEPVACSFIYLASDCDFAQIAWTTTNPDSSLRDRYDGVDACIKGLLALAKKYNKSNVVCISDSSGLTKVINKNGLKKLNKHDFLYSKLGAF